DRVCSSLTREISHPRPQPRGGIQAQEVLEIGKGAETSAKTVGAQPHIAEAPDRKPNSVRSHVGRGGWKLLPGILGWVVSRDQVRPAVPKTVCDINPTVDDETRSARDSTAGHRRAMYP